MYVWGALGGVSLSFSTKCPHFCSFWVTPGWVTYFLLWVLLSPRLGGLLGGLGRDWGPSSELRDAGVGMKPMRLPAMASHPRVSLSPQLQAPLRRFLRQEMVVEVVRAGSVGPWDHTLGGAVGGCDCRSWGACVSMGSYGWMNGWMDG